MRNRHDQLDGNRRRRTGFKGVNSQPEKNPNEPRTHETTADIVHVQEKMQASDAIEADQGIERGTVLETVVGVGIGIVGGTEIGTETGMPVVEEGETAA